ncbi:MAG TPA: winged helix-turn-helix domain-containing protein [Thermoanaerobaculia bacterium]|nr:winged helix-turn-helix domain-containing protein [Thermoanaerobaculia bacterium]
MTAEKPPFDRSPFEVAGATVRPELNRVDLDGGTHVVEPKVMEVLLLLAEEPGEVRTREEILDRVWAQTAVTDDVLTRSVGELRRLLGDDSKQPRVIETIRKRGYRLIAPVRRGAAAPVEGNGDEPAIDVTETETSVDTTGPGAGAATASPRGTWALAAAIAAFAGVALWATAFRPTMADADRSREALRLLPLAAQDRLERDPALAPDGHRVAYSRLAEEGDRAAIWIQARTATGRAAPVRLTAGDSFDRYPVFSPDGAEIAFVRDPDGSCELLVIPSTGGRERRLAGCDTHGAARFDWSPAGDALVVSRRLDDGRYAIHLLDLETSALRRLTDPQPPFRADVEPRFSPDGRHVAFGRIAGSAVTELWTVAVESGRETRLTHDHREVMGQAWSEDGRSIIFSSNRAGQYGLWAVAATGGDPRWLAGGGSKIKHPVHARHSPLIAWEDWQLEINVWRVPLERPEGLAEPPGAPPPAAAVARSTQWDYAPAISPDGSRLAFLSSRGGDVAIWVQELASGEAFPVSGRDQHAIAGPAWSPDGSALAWVAWHGGRPDLFVTGVDAYAPRRITDDDAHEIAPSFTRDGDAVLVGSDRTGDWQVWRVPLDGRPPVAVTTEGGLAAQEGRDGNLYLVHPVRDGIWRRNGAEGAWSAVEGAPRPGHWANWQVGTGGLWVLTHESDRSTLVRLPLAGGERRVIASLDEIARPGIAISEDETALYLSRVDRAECDLLLAENLLDLR